MATFAESRETDGGSCAVDVSADYPLHPPDLNPGADEAYLHTLMAAVEGAW